MMSPPGGRTLFGCLISLLALAIVTHTAEAALFTAKAAYTGDWSSGSTWTNVTVPGNGDSVEITNAGSSVVLSSASLNLRASTTSRSTSRHRQVGRGCARCSIWQMGITVCS